ncbi:hypothetical protein PTQ21_24390 [Paenibacillus marchantiae]|uniref:hypothetical protein n=1 Tax=Paenibacillus TaxID=44249 RepID=UPI00092141B0|nr:MULTISPECIES: hypothetical protein [Paenibacillus]WDQ31513.1 hypothetical protein PTQ21_24390 [Paenibacillus marchantiae]SHN62842.1 hypothetical protein SAMN04487896_1887 [Paenibacillus sp. ov031]
MKRLRKFSISVMATACLLAFGSSSALAKTGWADTFETAEVMYSSVNQNSGFSATQYLDSMSDNDYYLVDNTNGSSVISFGVIATPPPNFDIIMGVIKMDASGAILSIQMDNWNGPGYAEAIGMSAKPGEKVYFRIMDNGINNYNQPYTIQFTKHS